MSISTDGIVIKVNNVGEYNRSITVLTADYGIIHAFVHGARSLKNKNGSATSLLCYSHFTFSQKKDTYTVTDATVNKVFFSLNGDIEKLALAQYFCELALCLGPVDDDSREYLRLMLNSLNFLSNSTREPLMLKSIMELRLLSISGYTPDIVACGECGEFSDEVMFFDPIGGSLYCGECRPDDVKLIPIGSGTLASMRHIVYSDFEKLYNFSIPEDTQKNLNRACEAFLLSQTERRFTTLEFLKELV